MTHDEHDDRRVDDGVGRRHTSESDGWPRHRAKARMRKRSRRSHRRGTR